MICSWRPDYITLTYTVYLRSVHEYIITYFRYLWDRIAHLNPNFNSSSIIPWNRGYWSVITSTTDVSYTNVPDWYKTWWDSRCFTPHVIEKSHNPTNCFTHIPIESHICVSVSGQHWFRQWFVAFSAPSNYPNQYCVIVNWTLSNKLKLNFNQNIKLFIHEIASQIIVCEMAAILQADYLHCREAHLVLNIYKKLKLPYYTKRAIPICALIRPLWHNDATWRQVT